MIIFLGSKRGGGVAPSFTQHAGGSGTVDYNRETSSDSDCSSIMLEPPPPPPAAPQGVLKGYVFSKLRI